MPVNFLNWIHCRKQKQICLKNRWENKWAVAWAELPGDFYMGILRQCCTYFQHNQSCCHGPLAARLHSLAVYCLLITLSNTPFNVTENISLQRFDSFELVEIGNDVYPTPLIPSVQNARRNSCSIIFSLVFFMQVEQTTCA